LPPWGTIGRAFRLAADHPEAVTHLPMLDVPEPGDQPSAPAIAGRRSRGARWWPSRFASVRR